MAGSVPETGPWVVDALRDVTSVGAALPPVGAVMVMVMAADFVLSVIEVALSVTVAGFGAVGGAV
jgi:hypothetical protein